MSLTMAFLMCSRFPMKLSKTHLESLHIKHAHEEVHHCNIELYHFHSSIAAENCHFKATLQCLKAKSNTLYHSIKEFPTHHIQINSHNLTYVYQTFSLAGFTGDKMVGMKKNLSTISNHSLTHTDILADQQNDKAESDIDEEDEACGVVGATLALMHYSQATIETDITLDEVHKLLLGGQDPGIVNNHLFIAAGKTALALPLVVAGKTAPALPLVVTCESTKQAQHVMTLKPFINLLSQQVLQTSVADALLQSKALKAIFLHHTPFYSVVYADCSAGKQHSSK
ncbi:hypothetical protein DFH29DRAFT_874610 [Suillus ampliporus]|nr:hypothetical protein DFH29DRAFT_874610 [Suillus ampliporus]